MIVRKEVGFADTLQYLIKSCLQQSVMKLDTEKILKESYCVPKTNATLAPVVSYYFSGNRKEL